MSAVSVQLRVSARDMTGNGGTELHSLVAGPNLDSDRSKEWRWWEGCDKTDTSLPQGGSGERAPQHPIARDRFKSPYLTTHTNIVAPAPAPSSSA